LGKFIVEYAYIRRFLREIKAGFVFGASRLFISEKRAKAPDYILNKV